MKTHVTVLTTVYPVTDILLFYCQRYKPLVPNYSDQIASQQTEPLWQQVHHLSWTVAHHHLLSYILLPRSPTHHVLSCILLLRSPVYSQSSDYIHSTDAAASKALRQIRNLPEGSSVVEIDTTASSFRNHWGCSSRKMVSATTLCFKHAGLSGSQPLKAVWFQIII